MMMKFKLCGMLRMWYVLEVGSWGCAMLGMCDVRDVGCLGCSGCGILRMWDIRDVECSRSGIWDVGSLPGCGMLIYKMPGKWHEVLGQLHGFDLTTTQNFFVS